LGIAVGVPGTWSGVMKLALIGLLVAVTTAAAALAAPGDPHLAWWALAAGGAVLAVADAQTLLLPARFIYPLAGGVRPAHGGSSHRPRWAWVMSGSPR
jgi:hypothetical protein